MTPPNNAQLHEQAREWVRRALVSSFPENHAADPKALEEYGDALLLIGEMFQIPVESLVFWIHDKPQDKDFSQSAWRLWCAKYDTARNELPPEATQAAPEPARVGPSVLCTRCFANAVQQIGGSWWCAKCGQVQQ